MDKSLCPDMGEDPSKGHLRWNGWGYRDTGFFLNASKEIEVLGSRYAVVFESKRTLPKFVAWAEKYVGMSFIEETPVEPFKSGWTSASYFNNISDSPFSSPLWTLS